jgi:hypothetical protein
MMVSAFVGFILVANVAAYSLWYGIEKTGAKLSECVKACGTFCNTGSEIDRTADNDPTTTPQNTAAATTPGLSDN